MAVVDVKQSFNGSEAGVVAPDGNLFQSEDRAVYTVLVNDHANDTNWTALQADGIPQDREPHPTDSTLRVARRYARRRGPVLFEVFIDYASNTKPGRNPLLEPPIIEFSDLSFEEPIDLDINGDPIMTVAGEPIQGITEFTDDFAVTITRNVPSWDAILHREYIKSTNSDTFLGNPPGTGFLDSLKAFSVNDSDFSYFRFQAVVIFRRSKNTTRTPDEKVWWKRCLHQGFRKLTVPKGSVADNLNGWIPCRDKHGHIAQVPMLLKEDGTQTFDPAEAHWLHFQTKHPKPFGALGLI